ncbi:hypothetical protein Agabi119p4_8579 [Agaricus bisporus var. burnettii]|uniref:Uncharacterized protein n=1 Tax=Agaricus bisporus var. burnettii TaxID=192524 RepID=A0A8H7C717_AGABI|nr:hypothetical protein Agabi119p4_8579 [Agaricus bisporus var. burnettii]
MRLWQPQPNFRETPSDPPFSAAQLSVHPLAPVAEPGTASASCQHLLDFCLYQYAVITSSLALGSPLIPIFEHDKRSPWSK